MDDQNLFIPSVAPGPSNRQPLSRQIKILIFSVVGILVLAGLSFTGYYFWQKNGQPAISANPTPWQSLPVESSGASPNGSAIVLSNASPFGIHDPTVPEVDRIADVATIGAKWVRYAALNGMVWDVIETKKGQYNWSRNDSVYLDTYKSGIKMLITTGTGNTAYGSKTENNHAIEGYFPPDSNAYKTFLKKAVERYDGDGVDDAPGSPIVAVWQIENELDLSWKDTPAKYAELLKESYLVIKEANPNAQVAIAGVAFPNAVVSENGIYRKILKELDKIKNSSPARYFDIFDFHWYPFGANYLFSEIPEDSGSGVNFKEYKFKEYADSIKNILAQHGYANIPIYITEFGQYDGLPTGLPGAPKREFCGEKTQALDLFKGYIYALAHGVSKIFQVTLTEWHNFGGQVNGDFDNVGLINNPSNDGQSHKKLSYYTYKLMAEKLEGSDWDNIQIIQETESGVYAYKFTKSGKSIWVLWNDGAAQKSAAIANIKADKVKITEAVSNYESGKEIKDYNSAFNVKTETVTDEFITVLLKDKPVIVEE